MIGENQAFLKIFLQYAEKCLIFLIYYAIIIASLRQICTQRTFLGRLPERFVIFGLENFCLNLSQSKRVILG